jgi:hypothetical protein
VTIFLIVAIPVISGKPAAVDYIRYADVSRLPLVAIQPTELAPTQAAFFE